jgi:hypothetical protein
MIRALADGGWPVTLTGAATAGVAASAKAASAAIFANLVMAKFPTGSENERAARVTRPSVMPVLTSTAYGFAQ